MAQKKDATPVRKISIKTVCGTPDIEEVIKAKKIDLMDVFGIVTRMKTTTSDYGESVKFIGQFRATNLATGELFKAPSLFLPKAWEEELSAAMTTGANAEFALRVSVLYDKTSATKYVYDCVSLFEPQVSDAMLALEAKFSEAQKRLPAPKKS